MKNIKDRINNKLFKQEETVELSAEKVELGLVQDLDKLLSRMKAIDKALMKSVQEYVNQINEFSKVQSKLESSYNQSSLDSEDAEGDIKQAVDLVGKISKQAKDLGFDPKDIKGMSDVVRVTENLEDTIAIFKRNESDAKKILSI